MKKLNEKRWQRFSMNNVFNIGHGFYNKKPPMSPNGTVPFVGASGINNGITGFCTMQAVRDNSKVGYGLNEPIERKDSGEPDYEYMEQYVKNMMLRKYRQYLTYLDRQSKRQE